MEHPAEVTVNLETLETAIGTMKSSEDPVVTGATSATERKTKRKAAKFAVILIAEIAILFFFLYVCIAIWAAKGSS